ncbi:hypothetical protein ACLB1Q_22585 [Escherichia coli]
MGPHTFNFKDICARLEQASGLITVTEVHYASAKEVSSLLTDADYRSFYGRHAVEVLYQKPGRATASAGTAGTFASSRKRIEVVMQKRAIYPVLSIPLPMVISIS